MRSLRICLAILLLATTAFAQPPRPVPAVEHVVIISVDGLRPDLALRANTPNLRKLMANGSFSMWARSTEMSVTLPSHTSMLTGTPPDVHGIKFNDDGPLEPVYPKVPTIFELAHQAGFTTAMATGKSKLVLLAKPKSVDWIAVPARGAKANDDTATSDAVKIILEHKPGVLFIHLPTDDSVGHAIGWGSPEQIKTIEHADECIGKILAALEQAQLMPSTFILLNADHGGRMKWHGPNDPRARHIPWIVSGPGIRKNFDLDTVLEKQVNIEDTFATSCTMLGIPLSEQNVGKMIWQILEKPPVGMIPVAIPPATRPALTQPAAVITVP